MLTNLKAEFVRKGLNPTHSLKEMMEEVMKGAVDCVIVKDLSRFGRNHLYAHLYPHKGNELADDLQRLEQSFRDLDEDST